MNKNDIKRSFNKICPKESLIADTIKRTEYINERNNSASSRVFSYRYALSAVCACLFLIFSVGMTYIMETRQLNVHGSFSSASGYTAAADTFVISRITPDVSYIDDAPVDDIAEAAYYNAFDTAVAAMGGQKKSLIADAKIERCELYMQSDNDFMPGWLYLIQIRLSGVIRQPDALQRSYREGDSITVAIWLNAPAAQLRLPGEGELYRFCLYTGRNGSPDDDISVAAGLTDVYMMYGCYAPDGDMQDSNSDNNP